jgi:MFS transporter, ACS family, solute carrier family 17 (sodium-dependent inorganic phosphate cotransporter), other
VEDNQQNTQTGLTNASDSPMQVTRGQAGSKIKFLLPSSQNTIQHSTKSCSHHTMIDEDSRPLHSNCSSDLDDNDSSYSKTAAALGNEGSVTAAAAPAPSIPGYIPRRMIVAVLMGYSTISMYLVRTNISDSIIDMSTEFGWSDTTQGLVLSSFYYGYIIGQMPGAYLAKRFGGKLVLGISVVLPMVFTLLTPLIARNLSLMVGFRILMGLFESSSYPAILELLSAWAPKAERSRLCSIAFAGAFIGTITSMLFTPVTMQWGGWPLSFYLYGGHGIWWGMLWWWFAASTPQQHASIHPLELDFIVRNLQTASDSAAIANSAGSTNPAACTDHATVVYEADFPDTTDISDMKYNTPVTERLVQPVHDIQLGSWTVWRTILTDSGVWAVVAANFCVNWGLYVMIAWLPKYLDEQWGIGVKNDNAGWMAALPFTVWVVFSVAGGWSADFLIGRRIWTVSFTRLVFQAAALILSGAFATLLSYYAPSLAIALMLVSLSIASYAFATSGYIPAILGMFYVI